MTKEENPQTQERDFPLSWKAQTPRFPHSHRTATAAVSRFNTQSKPQPRFALLATFPTYPQIPRRRHFYILADHGDEAKTGNTRRISGIL